MVYQINIIKQQKAETKFSNILKSSIVEFVALLELVELTSVILGKN